VARRNRSKNRARKIHTIAYGLAVLGLPFVRFTTGRGNRHGATPHPPPKRRAHSRANAPARAGQPNRATATAPESERDDGRNNKDTNDPARKAEKARERAVVRE